VLDILQTFSMRDKPQMSQESGWFNYEREKEGIKFFFFSERELNEEQLSAAMDIIYSNARKGTQVAHEVFEKCFKGLENERLQFRSEDQGKCWIVKISNN